MRTPVEFERVMADTFSVATSASSPFGCREVERCREKHVPQMRVIREDHS